MRTCGDDALLRGKRGSQMVWLTDEGWQKVMPNRIELWDIFVFDSFNKRGGMWRSPGGKATVNRGWHIIPRRVSGKEWGELGGGMGGRGVEYTGPCGVTVMSATIIVCCNFLSN